MSVKEGQPFSATYNKLRGAAGGMNDGKCDTEFKDNSFDAGASYAKKKNYVKNGIIYAFLYDNGRGCPDPPHLYGLGETMPRKMDDASCGLFNHGHTAAVAFHNPETVYTETKCNGKFGSVMFQASKFAADIDKNPDDMAKANVTRYMKSNEERLPSQRDILELCIADVKDADMKKELTDILNHVTESYTLTIMKLMPGSELPDDCSRAFTANERMYYYNTLCKGRSIMVETSDGKKEIADKSNAIDPLSDRVKFKVLESTFTAKKSVLSDNIIAKVTINNKDNADSRTLYIYNNDADGRRKFPIVSETCPSAEWNDDSPTIMILTGSTNAISEVEAASQLNKLCNADTRGDRSSKSDGGFNGTDFKTIDDIRGVFIEFVHRILGKPYWRKGGQEVYGWGAERNSGNARCCINVRGDDKSAVAKLMGFQQSKHNTDMDKCNLIIIRYLYCIFGIIIQKYTSCTLKNNITVNGKTTPWDLTELVNHIMGRSIRRPVNTTVTAVPLVRAPVSNTIAVPARAPAPVSNTTAVPARARASASNPVAVPARAPAPVSNTIAVPAPAPAPNPVAVPARAPAPASASNPVAVPTRAPASASNSIAVSPRPTVIDWSSLIPKLPRTLPPDMTHDELEARILEIWN